MGNVFFSSKTEEWATPNYFFNRLNEIFHFDLDVCATDENHKCEKYYTKEINGLEKEWYGNVWVNPPYGKNITKWFEKAENEISHCNIIVFLVPANTETKWFQKYVLNKAELHFVSGRLKFGASDNSAPFSSVVCIYYNNDIFSNKQGR